MSRRTAPRLELLEDRLAPAIYQVIGTADNTDAITAGTGTEADPYLAPSLRSAILATNANAGLDTIEFNISITDARHFYYKNDGISGQVSLAQVFATTAADDADITDMDPDWQHSWWRIQPSLGALPSITDRAIIDGFSQGNGTPLAATPNDNGPGLEINAVLRIELDGIGISGAGSNGLSLLAGSGGGLQAGYNSGSTVRGLVINNIRSNAITASNSGGHNIQGNFIGTDPSGTLAKGNLSSAARAIILGISGFNYIGTNGDGEFDAAERNLISANGNPNSPTFGTAVLVNTGNDNVIAGNFIGVDRTGRQALGNYGRAITINGFLSYQNRIGTDGDGVSDQLERNIISGASAGTASLASALPNAVQIANDSHHNVVAGNFIGTDVTGTQAIGNALWGVLLATNVFENRVGIDPTHIGDDPDHPNYEHERNVISGNAVGGLIFGINSHDNLAWGNYIGTQADGVSPLGNGDFGMGIGTGASHNQIGGSRDDAEADVALKANTIAFNGGPGVAVGHRSIASGASNSTLDAPVATGNSIRGNAIYSNGTGGIDLGGTFNFNTFLTAWNGVTLNDSAGHVGPNNFQNFPVLTSALTSGAGTTVTGTFHSGAAGGLPYQPSTSIVLDFYANASRGHAFTDPGNDVTSYYGEGQTYLGSASVLTDANGNASFTVTLPRFVPAGQGYLSATATGPDGSTSELSANLLNLLSVASPEGPTVTLVSPAGTTLTDVAALPAPSPEQAPDGATFPVGAFQFTVAGVADGETAEVILYVPAGIEVNAYYKLNPATDLWELFAGATFEDRNGDATADIVLTLTDGGSGDADGEVNGRIVDPGLPAFVRPPIQVRIDIRPESLNLSSQGVLQVVLFNGPDFDVARVDLGTIRFAGAAVFQWSRSDINGDGRQDLVLHFRTQDTNLRTLYEQLLIEDQNEDGILDSTRQQAQVSLTGQTVGGDAFEGSDELTLFLAGKALRDCLTSLAAAGLI
jgi:hypothetical protein